MTVDLITQWAALAVGILAVVIGIFFVLRVRTTQGAPAREMTGLFGWHTLLSAIVAVLSAVGLAVMGPISMAWALIIGWLLMFLLLLAHMMAGRKLDALAGTDQVRQGYTLLSASGIMAVAVGLLGIIIIGLLFPSGKVEDLFLAGAIGFWIAAAFQSLPSIMHRVIGDVPQGYKLGIISAEMAFLTASGLAAAVSIANYRFGTENLSGIVYPFGVLAAALLFGILATPLLRPSDVSGNVPARERLRWWIGIVVFLVGTGLAAYYLATAFVADIQAFYCFGIGLITAMLLMLTARYRPPFADTNSPFRIEVAIAEVLMILAAAILAFRFMAGYGVALCGLGLLASFAILLQSSALWASRRMGQVGDSDTPLMVPAAFKFAEIVMAGGAFLLIVALLRLFTERIGIGIDITEPYPLIGLVIGGCFPIILRALLQTGNTDDRQGDTPVSGPRTAFKSAGIWLLAVLTPLLVIFFWRDEAAGAFLVGLAAAELFLILTLWLGEAKNAADGGARTAVRVTHVIAVGSTLVTVLLTPTLIELTGNLTRADKIKGLIAVLAVMFVWIFIVVWRRLRSER
ncbi:MAG: hypothetical protein ACYC27_10155 [Armatimonadota bacterium]